MKNIFKIKFPTKQEIKQIRSSWQFWLFVVIGIIYMAWQAWVYHGPTPSLAESIKLDEVTAVNKQYCEQGIEAIKIYLANNPNSLNIEYLLFENMLFSGSDDVFKVLANHKKPPLYDASVFYRGASLCRNEIACQQRRAKEDYLVEKILLNPIKLFIGRHEFATFLIILAVFQLLLLPLFAVYSRVRAPEKYDKSPKWLQYLGK